MRNSIVEMLTTTYTTISFYAFNAYDVKHEFMSKLLKLEEHHQ